MGQGQATIRPRGERFFTGSDHAGYELKEHIKQYLVEAGNQVEDFTAEFRERIDFPPVAEQVARATVRRPGAYGVLVCGTGAGMCMAANKVRGVRAVSLHNALVAEYARRHNNANVLCFGGRVMDFGQCRRLIETFFAYSFEGGKYAERNRSIERIGEDRG